MCVMKATSRAEASGQEQCCSTEGVKMQRGGRKGLLGGLEKNAVISFIVEFN